MVSVFSRRVISYFLDFFVVSAFMWILVYLLSLVISPADSLKIYMNLHYFVAVLIYVYFVLCEKIAGSTVGKSLLYLEVRSKNGAKISWMQALVRNLSKIYWFPIIFDWAIGKLLRSDRLLNNITRTVVVDEP